MSKVVKSLYTMVSDQRHILTIPVVKIVKPESLPTPPAQVEIEPEEAAEPALIQESPEELLDRARMEAEEIVSSAKKQAELLLEEAARQAEEQLSLAQAETTRILNEARETGYQDGYEAGRKDAEKRAEDLIQQAVNMLQQVEEEKRTYYLQAEKDLVELACAISRKIMGREVEAESSWILTTVQNALSEIVDLSKVEIYANPLDIPVLAGNKEELLSQLSTKAELNFLPDSTIEKGGCILRTKQGSVDARIDIQLNEVKRALLEAAASL